MVSRRSLVAGSIGSTIAAAAVALPARCSGNVYPGTIVQGLDLSGMTESNAENTLRSSFQAFENNAVTYAFEGQTWRASLADLGMRIDYDRTLEMAMNQGRDGSVADRYLTLLAMGDERQVHLAIERSDLQLDAYLAHIASHIDSDAIDARLVRRGSEILILDPTTGRRLNLGLARSRTIAAVSAGRPATVPLTTIPLSPDITPEKLEAARQTALRLISEPLVFTLGDDAFPFDRETLTDALIIDRDGAVSLSAARLQGRIDEIERAVFRPAQNVKLGWDSGLYVVAEDQDGVALDRESLEHLLDVTARSATRTSVLPVTAIKADARADNLDALGIDGHLAYGSSSFAGSSRARATNVVVSATNISYQLVGPGESFSFNNLLGEITAENGFVQGTIILGDWTATDIGGGVCQVSTTVFRAALNAGFRFREWHPHSWRLGFYETDGSPPGHDAAIYQPNTPHEIEKDLVFENPLDSWLLLMMVIDGGTVRAHLYGRDNGWNVEVYEARVGDPKPVGEPIERQNPSLAPGERSKVQNARAGSVVRVRRRVTDREGNVVSDGDFVSDYRSQPDAWEYGPNS